MLPVGRGVGRSLRGLRLDAAGASVVASATGGSAVAASGADDDASRVLAASCLEQSRKADRPLSAAAFPILGFLHQRTTPWWQQHDDTRDRGRWQCSGRGVVRVGDSFTHLVGTGCGQRNC
jgi:hypothetical protein